MMTNQLSSFLEMTILRADHSLILVFFYVHSTHFSQYSPIFLFYLKMMRSDFYVIAGMHCSIVKHLGSGAFGEVGLAKTKDAHHNFVALKIVDPGQMATDEFKIHMKLSRRDRRGFVPHLYGKANRPEKIIFAMEYLENGNLEQKAKNGGLTGMQVKSYFKQLVLGVKFIHKQGIVHRDLKPANLLLSSSNDLKIADFGLACVYRVGKEEQEVPAHRGTPIYFAPEVFTSAAEQKRVRGPPVDIWATGLILSNAEYQNWRHNVSDETNLWDGFPDDVMDLLRQILCHEVEGRATIDEIISHSYFNRS
uniref:Protein kinase domain-containing protein n=3 Tax=Caenorhabditis tropicalis TaxID=1561998 RepID=A0A1I7U1Z5_9PELO